MMQKTAAHKRRLLWLGILLVAAAAVAAGVSYSWFVSGHSLSTVAGIQKPAEVEILGPNASQMTQIDLSYTDEEKDTSNTVTIYRPFTVRTDGNFVLYLAHTTNIKGLDIQLYPAVKTPENGISVVTGVTDGATPYNWTISGITKNSDGKLTIPDNIKASRDLFAQGNYLNLQGNTGTGNVPALAQRDDDYYKNSFGTYGKNDTDGKQVQKNAAALYRLLPKQTLNELTNKETEKSENKSVVNYILRLSWQETEKETDVLYLIAKNISKGSTSGSDASE